LCSLFLVTFLPLRRSAGFSPTRRNIKLAHHGSLSSTYVLTALPWPFRVGISSICGGRGQSWNGVTPGLRPSLKLTRLFLIPGTFVRFTATKLIVLPTNAWANVSFHLARP
jgi:hypothetical protein